MESFLAYLTVNETARRTPGLSNREHRDWAGNEKVLEVLCHSERRACGVFAHFNEECAHRDLLQVTFWRERRQRVHNAPPGRVSRGVERVVADGTGCGVKSGMIYLAQQNVGSSVDGKPADVLEDTREY